MTDVENPDQFRPELRENEELDVSGIVHSGALRMNIHKNARLTPSRREEMAVAVIERRLTQAQAALAYGVSAKIVARWVERFRAGGRGAMLDRSSRPHAIPGQTGHAQVQHIITLRRQRLTGQRIAMQTGLSAATVSRVLKRAGLSRLDDIEPATPTGC